MAKYYGIGTWWKEKPHQQFYNFIREQKACIHASLNKPTQREISNREKFRDIFHRIKEKDIIYLKSFKIRGHKVRIRAVGKVKPIQNNDDSSNNIFYVNINYNQNYDYNGIIEDLSIDDDIQRNMRIYQETNPEVIKLIDELLQK